MSEQNKTTHTLINVLDYEKEAEKRLQKMVFDYYKSGAHDEITLNETREIYKKIKLVPRVLKDVSKIDTKTSLLGQQIDFPICIAPTAMQRMAHPDGETATAKAAKSMNTIMILSTLATSSIKEVRRASPDAKLWYQLYVTKNRDLTRKLVKRAEKYGYHALVLTVDTPRLGSREADHRNNFKLPENLSLPNLADVNTSMNETSVTQLSQLNYFVSNEFDASLTWKDVAWLKSITHLKVIVKGVVSYQDARLAVKYGVDGIIVSNHGCRQLDTVITTIEALPDVVKGVRNAGGKNVEVYLDGGIRRGTDVLKALALGAKAVFIGRPVLWGLSVNGQQGVEHVLKILKNELELAMCLCGCAKLRDIHEDLIYNREKKRSKL